MSYLTYSRRKTVTFRPAYAKISCPFWHSHMRAELSTVFSVIPWFIVAWWALWIILAIYTRAMTVFAFLLGTGLVWRLRPATRRESRVYPVRCDPPGISPEYGADNHGISERCYIQVWATGRRPDQGNEPKGDKGLDIGLTGRRQNFPVPPSWPVRRAGPTGRGGGTPNEIIC